MEGGDAAVTEWTSVAVGARHRRRGQNAVLLFLTDSVIKRERNV
jgi:hypothetical protein